MFGYLIAAVLGLVLLGFLIAGFSQQRPGPGGPRKGQEAQPLQSNQPAADEPTPDRSVTASKTEIAAARRHTPPA